MTETIMIGRNEPCPCRSGKKYKRCCGVSAAPKLTLPKDPPPGAGAFDPGALGNMDPQVMMQFTQALQRLPKGQLQRLQNLMQKAMSGKDVGKEAAEFEKSLPMDFQNMIQSMSIPTDMLGQGATPELPELAAPEEPMTEEKARALIAEAAAAGKISQQQADALLTEETKSLPSSEESNTLGLTEGGSTDEGSSTQQDSKFGKFWRNIAGKKSS